MVANVGVALIDFFCQGQNEVVLSGGVDSSAGPQATSNSYLSETYPAQDNVWHMTYNNNSGADVTATFWIVCVQKPA
jgi:hypothetical protein